jgi:hypothetical protein
MMMSVCQGTISSSSRYVLITPRPEAATLLSQAIARDSLKNETQLTGRLLILKADSQTLTEVFAPAELLTAPHADPSNADPSKLPISSTALHSQPLVPLVAESTAGGL